MFIFKADCRPSIKNTTISVFQSSASLRSSATRSSLYRRRTFPWTASMLQGPRRTGWRRFPRRSLSSRRTSCSFLLLTSTRWSSTPYCVKDHFGGQSQTRCRLLCRVVSSWLSTGYTVSKMCWKNDPWSVSTKVKVEKVWTFHIRLKYCDVSEMLIKAELTQLTCPSSHNPIPMIMGYISWFVGTILVIGVSPKRYTKTCIRLSSLS